MTDSLKYQDNLKRALEMEETMATILVKLCQEAFSPQKIPADQAARINQLLVETKTDTERHRALVLKCLAAVKEL